ncbi:glycoside hydrolase family 16 protein [Nocardioides sp. YIM 152315]|uniref:glycoside hydrolase family 16 protein n=1 Tax=Nocardioides sp. YIM 152315 TaxID=3031760 RepID=UPI0023DC7281|nr:glycoside hydrolase family 16 protein [Nocardioides sp. YIM 152315]MDF1604957.1 glycoside hydrolase family 16 protein [Nocardioides sp. YIM 152315]
MTTFLRSARAHRKAAATLVVAAAFAVAAAGCSGDDEDEPAKDGIVARMLPPVVDTGEKAHKADKADLTIEGSVEPAVGGETVQLEVRRDDEWSVIDTDEQDTEGNVVFVAPYRVEGEPQTYRLVAGEGVRSEQLESKVWEEKLAFDEPFDGDSLGDRWMHRLQGYSVEARDCSKPDPSMVEVGGGVAAMSVALDPDASGPCKYEGEQYDHRLNANFGTESSFRFKYGFAAARMKFHQERGQHAAFWMQPADGMGGGAEIDVIEWFGRRPHTGLASYVHYADGDDKVKSGGWIEDPGQYGKKWWKRYHVFSVEWTPEKYVFRIDGQITSVLEEGIAEVDEFLILSNLSSNYELELLPKESDLPQTTLVDWVRVWRP